MRGLGLFVFSLAVAVAGCVGMQAPARGVALYPARHARLLPPVGTAGEVAFQVSRSAHVAVFRIESGFGASMVYPNPGYGRMDGWAFAGTHRVRWDGLAASGLRMASTGIHSRPVIYFLVASEHPLRTDQLRVNRGLGGQLASASAFGTMERLVSLLVPDTDFPGWTTDYYVDWPTGLRWAAEPGHAQVRCPNGYTFYVPIELAPTAYQRLCPAREPGRTAPPDSSGVGSGDHPTVVEPIRRPAASVADRIASSQFEDPSGWEATRRALAEDGLLDVERPEVGRRGAVPDRETQSASGRQSAPNADAAGPVATQGGAPTAGATDGTRGGAATEERRPAAPPPVPADLGGAQNPPAPSASAGSSGEGAPSGAARPGAGRAPPQPASRPAPPPSSPPPPPPPAPSAPPRGADPGTLTPE